MENQKKTLEGVKVADLSHALAAPYGSMLLADQGADVIKIENPNGDVFRVSLGGAYAAVVNRNKRAISLDLKKEEGKEALRKIIADSDVLIESFTPGVVEKLGFGYEAVKKINPKIIYCSLSGFGQTGPYSKLGGYDVVAQSMSGIMACTGYADRPPVRVGPSIVDMGTGMYLNMGILLALMDRERTGKGQRVEVSLFETAMSWMSAFSARYCMAGDLPERLGSGFLLFAPYQVYESSDGYAFIGVSTDNFWKKFCDSFDLKELFAREDFATFRGRVAKRDEVNELVQGAMKNYTSEDIIARLRKAGVPCSPVNTVKDTLDDPHVKERGIMYSTNHPECGDITFPLNPIFRDGKVPEVVSDSPKIGQHTREILSELGYSDEQINELIASGAALDKKK